MYNLLLVTTSLKDERVPFFVAEAQFKDRDGFRADTKKASGGLHCSRVNLE